MQIRVAGRTIHAATGGRDIDLARPSVVFLHGAAMDHTAWALQSRYLAHRGCNTLALDLAGHGLSAGEPPATVEEHAALVEALLDETKIAPAILVGHSMGALIALAVAGKTPDKVAGLGLVGVAQPMAVGKPFLDAARDNPAAAIDMMMSWSHATPALVGGAATPGSWTVGANRRLVERARPGTLHTDLAACNDYKGGADAAAAVACPTMLVLGAADRMTPARAARPLLDIIPGARQVVIPDCGHMMMNEAPRAVQRALMALVEDVRDRRAAA